MKNPPVLAVGLVLLIGPALAAGGDSTASNGYVDAGVGVVDITPTEPVALAGSPTPLKSSSVSTRLYVKALVLSAGRRKVAIVTLDTLKYPAEHAARARRQVEKTNGIPAGNVILCASHTPRPAVVLLQGPTRNARCGGSDDGCARPRAVQARGRERKL